MTRQGWLGLVIAGSVFGAPVLARDQAPSATRVDGRAELKDRQGRTVARAELVEGPRGVVLWLRLTAAAPDGEHGFHVHEIGTCTAPTFESAGGHFNPTGAAHGMLSDKGAHLGDLPNIHVPPSGVNVELFVPGVSLQSRPGLHALLDDDGAALVIHAKPDDYRTDPSGDAGDRLACGVIVKG